jgi:L-ascorbate metabolism protein UlaG (beta-lactamase superfamily)
MSHLFRFTYIGGPTALLQIGKLRVLTDPTFDPAGQEFHAASYTLRKTAGPAVSPETIGQVDLVLLSHDHHFDNLDNSGRNFLQRARIVLTTEAGAKRLGGPVTGLAPWQRFDVHDAAGRVLQVTGTPARHGPEQHDRGPVIGFVLAFADAPSDAVYVSGDTVWYEGIAEIAQRFSIKVSLLFMGAARVPEVGPWHLTFTGKEGVEVARILPRATIVPLHFEGWAHLSESRKEIAEAFAEAGFQDRLRWGEPGLEMVVSASWPGSKSAGETS